MWMADTLRDNPFDASDLPSGLQAVVADLTIKIDSEDDWSEHHKDVFRAIRTCIIKRNPIDKELQDAYVSALANYQAVNRFGQ